MWLIHVATYELKHFMDPPQQYAILSHTWDDDEVLYQDISNIDRARAKKGWKKILLTCQEAKKRGFMYAWVDTCCIDKSNSAELDEAIRVMFEWYQQSRCCFVYLADFRYDQTSVRQSSTTGELGFEPIELQQALARCRWFTRGWTLQELIASPEVWFYDGDWTSLGTKQTLLHPLAEITGIDEDVLEFPELLSRKAVGRRMSWASKRQTTRIEDMAYCLLGIFDINMPLVYGEHTNAFLRLQEEIARQYSDLSLFAWCQKDDNPPFRGLFAVSPTEFSGCSSIINRNDPFFLQVDTSVLDKGVLLQMPEREYLPYRGFEFSLACIDLAPATRPWCGIHIKKFGDVHVRVFPDRLAFLPSMATGIRPFEEIRSGQDEKIKTFLVKKTLSPSDATLLSLAVKRNLIVLYASRLSELFRPWNDEADSLGASRVTRDEIAAICLRNHTRLDEFDLIHQFHIGSGGHPVWWECFEMIQHAPLHLSHERFGFAVVCGIPLKTEAPSEHLVPWFAVIASENDATEDEHLVQMLASNPRASCSVAWQRYVRDIIFALFADRSGTILQKNLPVEFSFQRESAFHKISLSLFGGGGGSTFCAALSHDSRPL